MSFNRSLRPVALLLALAPPLLSSTASAQTRGRDPWAFRMILENKTRMLVLALRPDLWAAYNPANGTLHKVWNGGIQFQGKVWDFSQRNSYTLGTSYYTLEDAFLAEVKTETSIPSGWTSSGVTTTSTSTQWAFSNASSHLTTPTFDLTRYNNVMVGYYAAGTASGTLLKVQVSTDNGSTWTAQNWTSMANQPEDGNQKQIGVTGSQVKVRFSPVSAATIGVRDISIFGDYKAWNAKQGTTALATTIDWRGYQLVNRTQGIIIKYDAVLPGNVRVAIQETPEALTGAAMTRKFNISGLPTGTTLSLELDGKGYTAARTVSGLGTLRTTGTGQTAETFLDFAANGETVLNTTWTP